VSVLGGMKWLATTSSLVLLRSSFFVLVLVLVDRHTRLFTRHTSALHLLSAARQSLYQTMQSCCSVIDARLSSSCNLRAAVASFLALNSHLSS